MEDFNFEQMLDDFLPEEKKSGDIVEGIITRKEMEYSYLDLGSKKEGRIISSEIKDFNVGDNVEVKVLREDEENIIVSKFVLDKEREFASYEVNEIVTGKVDKKIKGGYNVKVGKNNAFLPFSLSSFDKNVDYTGKEFKFIIKEKTKKSITVSRTDLVKVEEQEYFDSINEGDVVTGKVKEVLDFGVILDLGVTTGFVHISEVSWDQVNDLVERFGIGEEVSAKIIEKDSEKHKLKLSIKQLSQDPWEIFLSSHKVGDVVTAEVKEILDFGLIVSVDGNNGFVHVSELAWHNGAKALKNYNVNDKIEAKIIQIEEDRKNVKLSVKQLEENPKLVKCWKDRLQKCLILEY